ncbi:MAG: manganese efflux pump MntP family protein [Bacteroidales bacterium]|nr:manganese efflux pump MntP family protein [Bacteroidales bacterium]
MDFISIIIIAIGLSADSFAVSVSNGISKNMLKFKHIFLIAVLFAFFQAGMPLIGWFAGNGFSEYIKTTDHWIAFVLLSFIGIKMIYESYKSKENQEKSGFNFLTITAQAIATSIDALIIGISFAFIDVSIYSAILIIGISTFIFSLVGFGFGKKYGKKVSKHAELIGGIILILLGIKILIEHLFFH